MIVIPPIVITDAILTATNIAIGPNAEWAVSTSYSVGDFVADNSLENHKNYENLIAGAGKFPPSFSNTTLPVPVTIDWLDLGSTNRWAMFDQVNGTRSIHADVIDVSLTPNVVFNGLALLNIDAATVRVIVTDPTHGVVYDKTIETQVGPADDWYEFFFYEVEREREAVFLDLPAYPLATVRVILDNTGFDAAAGTLVIGTQKSIGEALHGTSTGIIDYSRKLTDDFGNTRIQERSFSKRADYSVRTQTKYVGSVQNVLTDLRSTPAVWIGDEDLSTTFVYGFIKDFEIILSDAMWSDISLQVEGLS